MEIAAITSAIVALLFALSAARAARFATLTASQAVAAATLAAVKCSDWESSLREGKRRL